MNKVNKIMHIKLYCNYKVNDLLYKAYFKRFAYKEINNIPDLKYPQFNDDIGVYFFTC